MKSTSLQAPIKFLTSLSVAIIALTPLAASAKDSPHNKKILDSIEFFEGLSEDALSGDATKNDASFKKVQDHRVDTRTLLPHASAAQFDQQFAKLEAAKAKNDNVEESLQAAELYKELVLALDSSALTIPKEVGLLDYISFRIPALLKVPQPDWYAIAATTKEANGYWATVRYQVSDAKLRDKMDDAQAGLATGSENRSASVTRANVQKDGDLVDLLEDYFTKKN